MSASSLEREFDYYARIFDLPQGEKEFPFAESRGRHFRFDRAWIKERVAVECEGGVYSGGRHVQPQGFERDCEKMNLATELGWRVFRFTTNQLRLNPAACIDQVARALNVVAVEPQRDAIRSGSGRG